METQFNQEITLSQADRAIRAADVSSLSQQQDKQERQEQNKDKLLEYIRDNIIGHHSEYLINTVYGEKPLIYADYTASGKSLKFIEDYISNQIMPMYANTHTLQSGTGKQTNNAREEARSIIKRVCGGNENDALVFVGAGATSAVNLLVSKLRVREIADQVLIYQQYLKDQQKQQSNGIEQNDKEDQKDFNMEVNDVNFCQQNRWGSYDCIICKTIMKSLAQYEQHGQTELHKRNADIYKQKQQIYTEKPVVFMSIYEHNSNVLAWREAGAHIELISMTEDGDFDYQHFESLMQKYKGYNSLKIATISAGSNVTGNLVDVDRVAVSCHRSKTLACFDYAAVVPYVPINMNGPTLESESYFPPIERKDYGLAYKDAVFFSPHKLVGGPQSSGVLIAKKNVLFSKKPARFGGGIVFFVNELDHEFVANVEELEEAGTPGVIQDIRAGLAFQLRESVSMKTIKQKELQIHSKALQRLSQMDNVFLLGNNNKPKANIYSFLVKTKFGKFLNPNYVVSILNDLFGIQSRAGCLCAALYGQKILGIDLRLSREFKDALFDGNEVLRVGFTRLNLNYFIDDQEINYIMDAIEFVSNYGWMLLPHYQFEAENGYWVNRDEKEVQVRSWLGQIDYSSGKMEYQQPDLTDKKNVSFIKHGLPHVDLSSYIEIAKNKLVKVVENYKNLYGKSIMDQKLLIPEPYQRLIWFLFPSEVLGELMNLKYQNTLNFEFFEHFNKNNQIQDDVTLPFQPKDYNKGKFQFQFSEEYLENLPTSSTSPIQNKQQEENKEEVSQQNDSIQTQQIDTQQILEDKIEKNLYEEEEDNFFSGMDIEEQSEQISDAQQKKQKLIEIPREIKSQVGSAIRDFDMIKDGDRVLIAVSGGKDSLSLIHILKYFQSVAPIKFDIGAVTVDPQVYEYNPRPLLPYMVEIDVPFFLESDAIVERAQTCMQKNSICSFCSRMKRGMIYNCARREGYNVIAMGQHLDDLAESFVMSSFHNGYLRTMKANYTIDKGDLRVIRPLVYCREALFKEFSNKNKLPIITENCPACFSAPKERHRVKLMLAQQENLFPSLFSSILKAITPLMKRNMRDFLKGDDKLGKIGVESSDEEDSVPIQRFDKKNSSKQSQVPTNMPCCNFN